MKRPSVRYKVGTALITLFVITIMTLLTFAPNTSFASSNCDGLLKSECCALSDGRAPLGTISVPTDSVPFVSEKSVRNRESNIEKADISPLCMIDSAVPEVSYESSFLTVCDVDCGQVLCGLGDPKTVQKRE